MSNDRMIDLLVQLKQKFSSARYFFFADEDFFARSVTDLEDLCQKYKRLVNMPFEAMTRAPLISDEKLRLLVDAGLWRLGMGIESGSDRTKRQIYKRFILNKCILKAAEKIKKFPQLVPLYFFIIGNPYEEEEDLLQTVDLIRKLPTGFYARMYNLILFPGTVLYQNALRDGIISGWQESGFEVDFLAGLKYRDHRWKQKNLYLNGLVFLMEGKSTALRVGMIPRCFADMLIHPRAVHFLQHHTGLIRGLIRIKTVMIRLKALFVYVLKSLFNDYISLFNRHRLLRTSVHAAVKASAKSV